MRLLIAALVALLPSTAQRLIGTVVLGWNVHPTARLGHSLILVDNLTMGPHASVASGNVIKGLQELRMGEGAQIHSFNWVSGVPLSSGRFLSSPQRRPALLMGRFAGLTSRHLIDCSDTVTLHDYAVVGGQRSTILTHSVNLLRNRAVTAAVEIGERSLILTNCVLLSGVRIAPRCIVSAGSVVNTPLTEELAFYRGNPAEVVRKLSPDMAIFHREDLNANLAD